MHRPLNGAVPERSEGGAQLKGVEATFHALRLRPSTAATGFSLAGEVEGRPPLRALAAGFSLAGEVEGGLRSGRWAQVVCLPARLKGGLRSGRWPQGLLAGAVEGRLPLRALGAGVLTCRLRSLEGSGAWTTRRNRVSWGISCEVGQGLWRNPVSPLALTGDAAASQGLEASAASIAALISTKVGISPGLAPETSWPSTAMVGVEVTPRACPAA